MKDNKGLTFVELISAVAIFSLVTFVIGSVVVVSARTFRKGTMETALQQEAQFAANRINGLIQDASSVEFHDGILQLETNNGDKYTIAHVGTDLNYTQELKAGGVSPTQLLAENIQDFNVLAGSFQETGAVNVIMTVENGGREYDMSYTMKARNELAEEVIAPIITESVSINCDDEIVMVPGETYSLPIYISSRIQNGIEAVADDNSMVTIGEVTSDHIEITLTTSAAGPTGVTIRTKDTIDGHPKGQTHVSILIRRVNAVNVVHTVNRANTANGGLENQGAIFTFYADVSGDNLQKRIGNGSDVGYKQPQAVTWTSTVTVDGVSHPVAEFFRQDADKTNSDAARPYITYELLQDMPVGLVFSVTAQARHAQGNNKASAVYGSVSGSDEIKPRETKINKSFELFLEPNESNKPGTVKLNMLGGVTSNVTFDFHNATDVNEMSGTRAKYDRTTDEVTVTVGNDEMGTGTNPTDAKEAYTFTIDVLVNGASKAEIKVHVCRIDEVSLKIVDNFRNNTEGNATYDFRLRYNTGDAEFSHMKSEYLIAYKKAADSEEMVVDSNAVKNILATRITWELIDYEAPEESRVKYKDSVICMGGVGVKGDIIGSYTAKREGYYQVDNVKPARIEQNAEGNWYLKQVPEIDIKPLGKGTGTGLPENTELKVTMQALHPTLGYNKGGVAYHNENVEASASVLATQTISAPTDLVIVEPGQGIDEPVMSEREMVVPLTVRGGGIERMEVTEISGNSSNATRASYYEPYEASGSTSSSDRTWYLGLVIGEDEKGAKDKEGNDTGRFDVTVKGYKSNGEEAVTSVIHFAVRRVNEVVVKTSGSSTLTNSAGSLINLDAYPVGFDENRNESEDKYKTGKDYYPIQRKTKRGETWRNATGDYCTWEQKGHGEYKPLNPMQWSLVVNGKEIQFSNARQISQYITDIKYLHDNEHHRDNVSFRLVQELPQNSEIKATSLHARGTYDGTDYNKSGRKYGDVSGSIKLGEGTVIDPDDPYEEGGDFLIDVNRGQDYNFTTSPERDNFMRYAVGVDQNVGKWFFRVREIISIDGNGNMTYGPWTTWRRTKENGNAKKLNAEETRSLIPDKRYELQMAFMAISESQRTIYWPYDTSLAKAGSGTGFEGYANAWNEGTQSTRPEDYTTTYHIGRAGVVFDVNNGNGSNVDVKPSNPVSIHSNTYYRTLGTASNPIIVSNGSDIQVNMTGLALEWGHYQGAGRIRVQKKTSTTWETVTLDSAGIELQNASLFMKAKIRDITRIPKGTYRLSIHAVYTGDSDWTVWDGNIWNPGYSRIRGTDTLFCGSNGTSGYVYIKVE